MKITYYKRATVYLFIILLLCLGVSLTAQASPLIKKSRRVFKPRVESQGTIIWNGFRHFWKKTPHRLNRLGSYFRNIDYDDDFNDINGERRSLFQVGELKDTGTVKIKGQMIKSSVLGIHHGFVKEDCLQVSGKLGQSASVKCHKSIDLEKIDFEDYDQVTVILRGFQLSEDSYASGYNTRGFAVQVIPVDHNEDTFDFDVFFSVHPEHAPDRPLPKWFPLGDDCGDCDEYTYSARIYFTVIGIKDEDGNLIDAHKNGTNSYSQYVKQSPGKKPAQADASLMETSLTGLPGYDHGIIAMQGIKWQLKNWNKTKKDGRYIRELKFNIANRDYDADTGVATFDTKMYFSNQGLIPEGFDISFTMWNALIQFNDDEFATSPIQWYSGTLSKGDVSYTRDVSYEFDE